MPTYQFSFVHAFNERVKLQKTHPRCTAFLCLVALVFAATTTQAQNRQMVDVKGSVTNAAGAGGKARLNISSTQGITVVRGNHQVTHINGIVLNAAGTGARAELNIASKTALGASGNQTVSIAGAVVNQAAAGKVSAINIGGVR